VKICIKILQKAYPGQDVPLPLDGQAFHKGSITQAVFEEVVANTLNRTQFELHFKTECSTFIHSAFINPSKGFDCLMIRIMSYLRIPKKRAKYGNSIDMEGWQDMLKLCVHFEADMEPTNSPYLVDGPV
jgi:hypothetical protein